MKQYNLKVRNVEDYNRYIGVATEHPWVSVVHYDELPPLRHSRTLWGIYAIFLLDDTEEALGYGRGGYAYSSGTLVCVAPGQIGGSPDNGTTFRRRGWTVTFHPSFFRGTGFEKTLLRYEYFHYHVNEALPMTLEERAKFITVLSLLRQSITAHDPETVIHKLLELLLAYVDMFYHKHFKIPSKKSSHIVSRLEEILDSYYDCGEHLSQGQPTVRECARRLCMAPNYLGDLIAIL